jgi:predicted transcriptional regulator
MRQSAGYSRKRVMQSASINRRKLRGYESGQFPIPLNVVGRLIAIYQVNPNDVQTVFYSAVKIFSSDE